MSTIFIAAPHKIWRDPPRFARIISWKARLRAREILICDLPSRAAGQPLPCLPQSTKPLPHLIFPSSGLAYPRLSATSPTRLPLAQSPGQASLNTRRLTPRKRWRCGWLRGRRPHSSPPPAAGCPKTLLRLPVFASIIGRKGCGRNWAPASRSSVARRVLQFLSHWARKSREVCSCL